MRKLTLTLMGALLLALTMTWSLQAQEVVAHIRGTVTDPSGAGVPAAEVKATNTQTQVSATVMTQDDGSYQFLSLPPGTYDVSVSKQGFKTFTSQNITLTLNQVYNLPVALEVGEVTQTVQVEANPVQVETTTTQLGTIIDAQADCRFAAERPQLDPASAAGSWSRGEQAIALAAIMPPTAVRASRIRS